MAIAFAAFTATAASLPPNLARSAKATATSEFSGQCSAQFAVDGKIPEAGSQDDLTQACYARAFVAAELSPRLQPGLRAARHPNTSWRAVNFSINANP